MKNILHHMWVRLERVSVLETDAPGERRRKVTLVVISCFCIIVGILSGTDLYVTHGPVAEVLMPFAYAIVVGIALLVYFVTKRLPILLYLFLFMILWTPFVLQWVSGGFAASSNVSLWAILAPFGSLMFQNTRKASCWFLAYLILLGASFYYDDYLLQFVEPASHGDFIVSNSIHITGLSVTIFVTMLYFVNAFQREHDRAETLVRHLQEANSKLETALNELRAMQAELIQSEKMASLGNLVAGVAHEVNSPIGVVNSAIDVLGRCIDRIVKAIETGEDVQAIREDRTFQRTLKILRENHKLLGMGSGRITELIQGLRNFARLDEAGFQKADLHEGLDSTLVLLDHRFKDKIEVVKDYGDIPVVYCYPDQLNQVFMNLLVNSIQAIEDRGTITIRTWAENDTVYMRIADTGVGIPPERMENLYEPGFSKQGPRVKAQLGLFTCYNIVQQHRGRITVESEIGKGAALTVILPINLEQDTENT